MATKKQLLHLPPKQGLYDPSQERDACGVGFIAHVKGQASHQVCRWPGALALFEGRTSQLLQLISQKEVQQAP